MRRGGACAIEVILIDLDRKALWRRGGHDHAAVYTDKGLHRVAPGQERTASGLLSTADSKPGASSENGGSAVPPGGAAPRERSRPVRSAGAEGYEKHYG